RLVPFMIRLFSVLMLRPCTTLFRSGSDQARLVNRLKSLGLFSDDTDSEGGDDVAFQDLDLEAVADLIDYVSEKFAVDSGKFDDFTRGSGGMERAVNLAVGFAGELGKESD